MTGQKISVRLCYVASENFDFVRAPEHTLKRRHNRPIGLLLKTKPNRYL